MTSQQDKKNSQVLDEKIVDVLQKWKGSRRLVIVVVAIGLLLDNMLLTSVVPIIPAFLYELHHEKNMVILNETLRTSTESPSVLYNKRLEEAQSEKANLLPLIKSAKNKSPKVPRNKNDKCNCDEDDLNSTSSTTEVQTTAEFITTTLSPQQKLRHEELVQENTEVGVMFASKPIVQAITNPFIGTLTNKIGYSWPLFFGLILLFVSTMMFAVGSSFPALFFARSLQGIGSSFTSVAGMGMIAERFPDDRERGNSMAIALGGLALGVLIGPPFGGIMYQFIGKSSPFIVLAFLALMDGFLQLFVLQPTIVKEEQEAASLLTLISDPYILIAAGAITFANLGIAILEPSLPLWMMDTMSSTNWEQGAAFLPASISYLIGTNIFGPLGHRMGRWLASMLGMIIIGFALLCIPLASTLNQLIIPNGLIGFAIGMVDSSMMPMLGYLVDIRHTSVYGGVYAIGDLAFCAGFVAGPTLSGTLVTWLGFRGLVNVASLVCFLFAPFMFMLRNPPGRNENQTLINESSVRYVNYTNDDSPDEDGDLKKQINNNKQIVVP